MTAAPPLIQRFTLVHSSPALPYFLVWQTRNAARVTLNGQPVASAGADVLSAPLHSATYQLVAGTASASARTQLRISVGADSPGAAWRAMGPGRELFALTLPVIKAFALHRHTNTVLVAWRVRGAVTTALQGVRVPNSGKQVVPRGVATLHLVASNAVGTVQRVLSLPQRPPGAALVAHHRRAHAQRKPLAGARRAPTATDAALFGPAAVAPVLLLNPAVVAFPAPHRQSASAPRTIHVVNLGPKALAIAGISISGPDRHAFSERDTCAGTTLDLYQGCTIEVSFRPGYSGRRTARLTIDSMALTSGYTVQLRGSGVK